MMDSANIAQQMTRVKISKIGVWQPTYPNDIYSRRVEIEPILVIKSIKVLLKAYSKYSKRVVG